MSQEGADTEGTVCTVAGGFYGGDAMRLQSDGGFDVASPLF